MGIPMEAWPRPHRITVEEYHRMGEVGLLAPDARVELIEGEIFDMPPIGSEHGAVVDQLARALILAVGDRAIARIQGAVRLNNFSEPQPDVALLKPRADFYRHEQPKGTDSLLVIEVSDSTLRHDRDRKVPLYARLGVPEVWIVDLQNGSLLFYRSPGADGYRDQSSTDRPGVTPIGALPGVAIDLSRLLQD